MKTRSLVLAIATLAALTASIAPAGAAADRPTDHPVVKVSTYVEVGNRPTVSGRQPGARTGTKVEIQQRTKRGPWTRLGRSTVKSRGSYRWHGPKLTKPGARQIRTCVAGYTCTPAYPVAVLPKFKRSVKVTALSPITPDLSPLNGLYTASHTFSFTGTAPKAWNAPLKNIRIQRLVNGSWIDQSDDDAGGAVDSAGRLRVDGVLDDPTGDTATLRFGFTHTRGIHDVWSRPLTAKVYSLRNINDMNVSSDSVLRDATHLSPDNQRFTPTNGSLTVVLPADCTAVYTRAALSDGLGTAPAAGADDQRAATITLDGTTVLSTVLTQVPSAIYALLPHQQTAPAGRRQLTFTDQAVPGHPGDRTWFQLVAACSGP